MGKFLPLLALSGIFFFIQTPVAISKGSLVVNPPNHAGLNLSGVKIGGEEQILAKKTMDLSTRHKNPWVNGIFTDNILLNLHYLKGDVENLKDTKGKIDWEKVREPFEFTLTLEPDQTFVYHQTLLSEFKGKNSLVGKTHFWVSEGYKSDGYLIGDGVCHLASLFNWVASEAGLEVLSRVNHDFLPVPEIPRKYGTSIFYSPTGARNSANQNLYITNDFSVPVKFNISADREDVEIKVVSEVV